MTKSFSASHQSERSSLFRAGRLNGWAAWLFGFCVYTIILSALYLLFPDSSVMIEDGKRELVLGISFFIPLFPTIWFTSRRLSLELVRAKNSGSDIRFIQLLRFHFGLAVILALLFVGMTFHKILSVWLLSDADITRSDLFSGPVLVFVFSGLSAFFWHYKRQIR